MRGNDGIIETYGKGTGGGRPLGDAVGGPQAHGTVFGCEWATKKIPDYD